MKRYLIPALMALIISGCSQEYDCSNPQIQPVFIGFNPPDIDSFVLRRYIANDGYRHLVDTLLVKRNYLGYYQVSNDTAVVFVNDPQKAITAGYDWQLYLPSRSRTVFISEISADKKTGKCGSGIFSLDKFGCHCLNPVYSLKKDGQLISYPVSDTAKLYVFIR